MPKHHILISGANGFIGRELVNVLIRNGHKVSALYRNEKPDFPSDVTWLDAGDMDQNSINPEYGYGVDIFVHLAAPKQGTSDDADGAQSQAARMAKNVADFVVATNIPRVICLSSIAATVAEETPENARRYGVEKLAADKILLSAFGSKQQLVILRPPAVYGPGMRGSIAQLTSLIRKGMPLPLGLATLPRDYISLNNLCSLIEAIISASDKEWAQANGKIFEPSDGQPISTRDLVLTIGQSLGRKPILLPIPLSVLRFIGKITGKSELISGAIDSLSVSINRKPNKIFKWNPEKEHLSKIYNENF